MRSGFQQRMVNMASIDVEEYAGPRADRLGLGLFLFHLGIGLYLLTGWIIASYEALAFYLLLLPLIALQWRLNQGSCIVNNFESLLRSGRWRDPESREEGAFLGMLWLWLLGTKAPPVLLDRISYGAVFALWTAGFMHLLWLFWS